MQRKPDAPSDSEGSIPLLTRRDALRRGLLVSLGMVAASGCAGGGDDEEEDEGD